MLDKIFSKMLRRTAYLAARNLSKNRRYLKYWTTLTCTRLPRHVAEIQWNTKFTQRLYCSSPIPTEHVVDSVLDHSTYERVCEETLDAINDYFDKLLENSENIPDSDLVYSDGVITINLGQTHGTYVINRQTPNRQIWLSSPVSGPKRFDFMGEASGASGKWVYKHTNQSLHKLLQEEMQPIFETQKLEFEDLSFGQ